MMNPDEIFGKGNYNSFAKEDSFNNNFVEGFISHHHGDDYGALLIEKINGEKSSQLIFCTPKISYPFDRNGNWHFPKAKAIYRYEKLDGTNIFGFSYVAGGQKFVSYKTRLMPFVQESKFGPFLSMWKEMLIKYPLIPRAIHSMNISFELWGARNPLLVKYNIPLETSVLFARQNGKIIPPLVSTDVLSYVHFPLSANFLGVVDSQYVENYKTAQLDMENKLKQTEDGYIGQEGEVWYLLDETGNWQLLKCKPETIEAIHFSSGGIGQNQIKVTCLNAFENWDNPTIENVNSLLLEEFQPHQVEKAHFGIEKWLNWAFEQFQFQIKIKN